MLPCAHRKPSAHPPVPGESLMVALEQAGVGLAASDERGVQTYVSPAFCALLGLRADELLGAEAALVGWPAEAVAPIREAMGRVRAGASEGECLELRVDRGGEGRALRLRVLPLQGAGAGPAGCLMTVQPLAQPLARGGAGPPEASGSGGGRRDGEQHAALLALTEELASAVSREQVADAALRRAVVALDARAGALYFEEGRELRLAASLGLSGAAVRAFARLPLAAGAPLADAYLEARPVWVSSPEEHAALYPGEGGGFRDAPPFDASVPGFACVPLVRDDVAFGVLALTLPEPRPWRDEERAFLTVLSRASAQTLERLRLLAQEREATEELGETLRTLEAVISASPAAIVLIDADTTVRLWNPGAERLFGWTRDEVLGRPLPIVPEERRSEFVRNVGRVDRGDPFGGVEVKRVTKSGALVDVAVWSAPIRRAEGRTQYLAVLADVSARKRAEQEREEARRDLAEAYAAVKAAERRKDEFLAMLGHELRNPLAPIVTALELMRLRDRSSAARERAVIERQVRHLTRLVDDLLDVSRITRGKVALRREPLDVAALLMRAAEVSSPLFEQKQHRLVLDVPRRGLRVLADDVRLTQVFANILANAAKYTPKGGRVDVVARREGDEVVVRVSDEGRGIDPDLLPHVFDPFVQGEQAVDRAEGGLGLGLAIVRNIVELHGGSVSASSPGPGGGSVFVVRLGALSDEHAASAPTSAPASPCSPAGRRVLVVDDNEDAAELLTELLRAQGHEVETAVDPLAALERVERFPAEVAIVDVGLPVMDGYELGAKLRDRLGAGLRLLAVTGYGQSRDRAKSAAAGFDAHFVKPVDFDALSQAVSRPARVDEGAGEAPGPG